MGLAHLRRMEKGVFRQLCEGRVPVHEWLQRAKDKLQVILLRINTTGGNNGLEETSAISVCYKKRETNSFASEYRGRMQRPEIKIDTVASVRKWRSRTISVGFLTGSEGARSQARLSFCELLGAG